MRLAPALRPIASHRLTRLSGGSFAVSDGCNQDLKIKRIMREFTTPDFIKVPGARAKGMGHGT
jgi:hypothetical protein